MSERLRLVTNFGELKAGMIVVVVACDTCRVDHRGMCVEFSRDAVGINPISKTEVADDIWSIAPMPPCGNDSFSEFDVKSGWVYRVVDGLENDATSTQRRKPVLAGERR